MAVTGKSNKDSSHLRVFLCHGFEDKDFVNELYYRLREDGVDPWLDSEKILPGQDWDLEIKRGLRQSDAILYCLSSTSVNKEGYLQKEIRRALEISEEKPEGTIFNIPVKIDECDLPSKLSTWQYIECWKPNAYTRILRALRSRAEERGIENLPGESTFTKNLNPIKSSPNATVYKTSDVQLITKEYYNGSVLIDDIGLRPAEQVIAITEEALEDFLSRFQNDERRLQEKEMLLALLGIKHPYREWQEATTKNYCFRNDSDDVPTPSNMERIRVNSSNLAFIGYNKDVGTVEVTFLNGSVYEYYNVPQDVYDGLCYASSHGRFLDSYIKKGGYSYRQIK